MVPGSGGITGQEKDVGKLISGFKDDGLEVEGQADQDQAIEKDALFFQVQGERCSTGGSIGFSCQKFG